MKIRTDFVTNSSSSSFVIFNLRDSEFCKYLNEQMKKNNFSYEQHSYERPASSVYLYEEGLNADISCPCEGLYCDDYAPECWDGKGEYGSEQREFDVYKMSTRFLDIIGEFIPLKKVDDLEKLYDAFVSDLENGKFKCDVYMGNTD
ncbi:MAG: hypothetical protein SO054_01695 [Ruminococcus callidus]|nr:hypothetical protein [Ruminococcus callidus]